VYQLSDTPIVRRFRSIERAFCLSYRAVAMIRLTVREIAEKEGIASPRELERATGLSYATAHALWNGHPRMIQLETIELICTRLGVRPGQLFEFEADRDKLNRVVETKQRQKTKRGKPERKKGKGSRP
jgi:DNA-binding Xre family transcriptional regulator